MPAGAVRRSRLQYRRTLGAPLHSPIYEPPKLVLWGAIGVRQADHREWCSVMITILDLGDIRTDVLVLPFRLAFPAPYTRPIPVLPCSP